jgi:hypothetical protein
MTDDVIEALAAATTPKGLPYPASSDPVAQGAAAIQALATAVDKRIPGIYANAAALPAAPSPGTIALVRVAADELVELAYDSTLGRWTSRPFIVLPGVTGGTSNNFGSFAPIGPMPYVAWAAAAAAGLSIEASMVVDGWDTSNGQNQCSARWAGFHNAAPTPANELDFARVDFGGMNYNAHAGGVIPWTP